MGFIESSSDTLLHESGLSGLSGLQAPSGHACEPMESDAFMHRGGSEGGKGGSHRSMHMCLMQPYVKWDNESLSISCQSPILRNGDLKAMAAVSWVYHRLGIAAKKKSPYSVFMVAFRQKERSVLGNRLLLVSECGK